MKPYIVAFGAGILIGAIYSLLQVRSPAPPMIALVGLLGILFGEQVLPVVKRALTGRAVTGAWLERECAPHVLGRLPGRHSPKGDHVHLSHAGQESERSA